MDVKKIVFCEKKNYRAWSEIFKFSFSYCKKVILIEHQIFKKIDLKKNWGILREILNNLKFNSVTNRNRIFKTEKVNVIIYDQYKIY